MPNQRSRNQTLVALALDRELLRHVDAVRGRKDPSAFIRDALAEEPRSIGIPVPGEAVRQPDRTRKLRSPQPAPPAPEADDGAVAQYAAEQDLLAAAVAAAKQTPAVVCRKLKK